MGFQPRIGLLALVATALCCGATFGQDAANQRRPRTFEQEPPAVKGADQFAPGFPVDWYKVDPDTGKIFESWKVIEGRPMPAISLDGWVANSINLNELEDTIVVVDFWSSRCGPCVANLPSDNRIATRLANQDVIWLSIHEFDAGRNRLPVLVRQFDLSFPLGVDDHGATSHKWRVPAHPFYCVVDGNGVVRAAGIKRKHIREVVEKLLAESDDASATDRAASSEQQSRVGAFVIPDDWLESPVAHRQAVAEKIDLDDPPLPESDNWLNTEPLTGKQLAGKVVMLDFWATWCAPCIRSIPHTNELYEQYRDDGLEIIGVCHPRGVERMAQVAEQFNIAYPVCADADGKITESYLVNSWPDYYFIDRAGRLRVIDCRQQRLEEIIKGLLNEPAPKATQPKNAGEAAAANNGN